MRVLPCVAAMTFALAGCGGGQFASHRSASPAPPPAVAASQPAPTQTPATSPLTSLIAVADEGGDGRITLSLSSLDGHQLAHTTLAPSAPWQGFGVGAGMLTFVDRNELKGLTPSNTVETLGPLAGYTAGPVIVSPDGQHWMWSSSSPSGTSTNSKLMLATRGAPDRVVAQETSEQNHLQPLRWTAAGPTYDRIPMGIGGYILFGDSTRGPSYRFDVVTGQVTPVLTGSNCYLADMAMDGTIACVGGTSQSGVSLVVLSPAGHVVEVPLPRPAFNQEGAIAFAPGSGGTTLVIGGATGAGADGAQERYETDVLDVGSREMRHLGPAGLRPADGPWSWLPDGSLVAYRPAGAFGGDPGIYAVAPDGTARKVLSSGTPLGVIAG